MKKVFITGISGFIGRHLALSLLDKGFQVSGSYLNNKVNLPPDIGQLKLDIRKSGQLESIISGFDIIVHCAALSHVGSSWKNLSDYYVVNFEGTVNLLDCLGNTSFVFISSSEVYGNHGDLNLREETNLLPSSPYAITKACAERVVLDTGGRVVRLFNVFGPGQSEKFAIPNFARQLMEIYVGRRKPVIKVGNLSPKRDFVYISDAVEAICRFIMSDKFRVLNVCSGKVYSVAEVLDKLISISGITASIEIDRNRVRPVDIPVIKGDNSKALSLGWIPKVSLEEGLQKLWEFYKGNV